MSVHSKSSGVLSGNHINIIRGIDTHMVTHGKRSIQLTLFLITFFILWTLRCAFFYTVDESIASPAVRAAYSNLLKFLVWILPAAVFVYVLRGTNPVKYFGLSVWPSRRNWLMSISLITAYLLVVALFKIVIDNKRFSTTFFSTIPFTYWLIMALLPPFLEELFFRGFLITELLALIPVHLAIVTSSFLFACIHLPYWLSQGALIQTVAVSGSAAFAFSILTGWLFVKTGSIWPSVLAHFAANLLPQFFV